MPEIRDWTQQSNYERKPLKAGERVIEQGPKFRSHFGWKNYQIAMMDSDPADADHYDKAFKRYLKDTGEFRHKRAVNGTKHKGGAHCHKTHWLMANKDFDGDECLFFPSMVVNRPEKLKYNYRNMLAARAMLLMTQGLPKDHSDYATHKCGNGHLSCVNPKHLAWGSPADNARDAVVHNAPSEFIAGMDPDMVAQIKSSPEMVKVIAWRTGIPAGVVSAIRLGEQFAA